MQDLLVIFFNVAQPISCPGHLKHVICYGFFFFLYISFIFVCKFKSISTRSSLRPLGCIPLIFCCLGFSAVPLKPRWSVWLHDAHHRKLSHPFSQLARPGWPRGKAARQSACQIQTWPWLFLLSTIQFCGVELRNMWPIFLVLFYPPATYIVPSRHLSLFFSVIFRSWGDNVFQAEPESLLPTCFPYVIEKHTNGLAGESSMPVGLLGLEWPVDSDPLIPQRG